MGYSQRVPSQYPLRDKGRLVLSSVLTALVVVHLVGLIRAYYVDVVYWDAWEMVPLLEKMYTGTASVGDFWLQANEHRPFFPRLILTTLARATHWDTRAEVALNLILASVMTLTVVLYLRQSRRVTGPIPFWVLPLATFFIFGPGQWENWLWGWEFVIFLQVACCVVGLYALSKPDAGWGAFAGALALGIIGSYSFGSGLVFWVTGPAVILLEPRPRRAVRLSIWMIVAVFTVGLYMHGWGPNPGHPAAAKNFESLTAVWSMAKYLAVYLGSCIWSFDETGALHAGLAGLGLFAWLVIVALDRAPLRPVLLWPLGLGLYAIAAGLLTTVGRTGFGTQQALASRYQTVSMPLWVGLVLFLGVLVRVERETPVRPRGLPLFLHGIIGAIALATLTSATRSEFFWQRWNDNLAPAREALRTNGDGLLQTRLYPNPIVITERRRILKIHRLSVFRRSLSPGPAK
jgi:hypothetical protein